MLVEIKTIIEIYHQKVASYPKETYFEKKFREYVWRCARIYHEIG